MNVRLLVDGNGVACRLWWANGNAVEQRFVNAITETLPTATEVLVCWDGPHSWRKELFPRYKANRPPKPEALIETLAACQPLFPGARADGFEADDLIATFARRQSSPVVVLSDDKDMLQLVGGHVIVVNSGRTVMTADLVRDKFGVAPGELRYLLSWMGDSSDGLPGVKGWGPKKSIEKALAHQMGDPLTWDLVELATVPAELIERWPASRSRPERRP